MTLLCLCCLSLWQGRLPDGFSLGPEPLAPERLALIRTCIEAMAEEEEALAAVDAATASCHAQPHRDQGGWSTWDDGPTNATDHGHGLLRREEALGTWVEKQMRTDRAAAALAEYEFPE